MESKDLRIGNLVLVEKYNHDKEEWVSLETTKVDGIYYGGINPELDTEYGDCGMKCEYNIHEEGEYKDYNDDYVSPIPLNEEWLIKFGFDLDTPILTFLGMNAYIILDDTPNKGLLFCKGIMPYQRLKCDYVHELQNIYFTLTGEELE